MTIFSDSFVGEISPIHECVILDNETEVIVSPKVRNPTMSNPVRMPARTRRSVSDTKDRIKKVIVPNRSKTLTGGLKIKNTEQPSNWSKVITFLSKRTGEFMKVPTTQTDSADLDDDDSLDEVVFEEVRQIKNNLPNLSLVLRVQPMQLTISKQSRSVAAEIASLDPVSVLGHPSTVFIHSRSLDESLPNSKFQHPKIFYAKIQKLHSPRDLEHEKSSKNEQKPEKQTSVKDKEESKVFGVVRVVVIDSDTELCDSAYDAVVDRLLEEQTVREGYIIIQDQLRQLLKLDVTGRVWLTSVTTQPANTQDLFLNGVAKAVSKLNT